MCEPYLCDDEIGPIIRNLHETVNCMYACEDVRDHINELLELSSRAEGKMPGAGIEPGFGTRRDGLRCCCFGRG